MAAGCNSRQAPDEGRFSGADGGFLQTRSPCSAVSSGDRGVRTAVEESQPWRDRRRASRPAGGAEEPVAGTIRFTRHDAIVITVRTLDFYNSSQMLANLTKNYPIESTPSNQSEPAHSPPRAIRLAGPPVVEFYDALRSAGHDQPPLGRVIKLSLTAETPGVDSAATRIAFLSASDVVIPQRSTTPPFTVTFSSKVCAQVCPFRWASSLSRMVVSESGISSPLRVLATA